MVRRVRKRLPKKRKRCRQRGGFLIRYDFAYAGRDTVNQAFKNVQNIAPGLMKQFSDQINKGGQKIEKIAPKIIRGAIEDVY